MITSTIVSNASLFVRITESVFSQHLRKTPSTPVTPIPSITSLVSLNGTCHQFEKISTIRIKNVNKIMIKDARTLQIKNHFGLSSMGHSPPYKPVLQG
jgi:hypothetical protein